MSNRTVVMHTPGPWSIRDARFRTSSDDHLLFCAEIGGPDSRGTVADLMSSDHCSPPYRIPRDEAQANAALIAAAPELLEVLRNCAKILPRFDMRGALAEDDEALSGLMEQIAEAITTATTLPRVQAHEEAA